MPERQLGLIRISGFGGTDVVNSPWQVDPRDAVKAQDVYTERGIIRKRPAIKRRFTTAIPSNAITGFGTPPAANALQSVFVWQTQDDNFAQLRYGTEGWETGSGDIDTYDSWSKIQGGASSIMNRQAGVVINGTQSLRFHGADATQVRYRRVFGSDTYLEAQLYFTVRIPDGLDSDWSAHIVLANGDTDQTDQIFRIKFSFNTSSVADVEIEEFISGAFVTKSFGTLAADTNHKIRIIVFSMGGVWFFRPELFNAATGVYDPTAWTEINGVPATFAGANRVCKSASFPWDRIILGASTTTAPDSMLYIDDVSLTATATQAVASKIFVVQGGYWPEPTIARLIQGEASDPGTAWTVVGDIANLVNREVVPISFGNLYVFPTVPNRDPSDVDIIPKKLTSTFTIANLGGSPPGMSSAKGFNRLLMAAVGDGLIRFSAIDNGESWISSDSLTVGEHPWMVSAMWDFGEWMMAVTETGVFAVRGFGRNTLRVDKIDSNVGTGEINGVAGDGRQAWFMGHDSGRRLIHLPTYNPYHAIYRVQRASPVPQDVSRKIATSSLFTSKTNWIGGRRDVLLEYDASRRRLYVVMPRFNPAAGDGTQEIWVMNEAGDWFKWIPPTGMNISFLYAKGLASKDSQTNPAGGNIAAETYLGGHHDDNWRFIYTFDEGYIKRTVNPEAKDVDSSGNQTQNISASWTFPPLRVFEEGQKDAIPYLWLFGKQTSGSLPTVEFRLDDDIDNDAAFTAAQVADASTALNQKGIKYRLPKSFGQFIQPKITFANDSVEPEIHAVVIGFQPRQR